MKERNPKKRKEKKGNIESYIKTLDVTVIGGKMNLSEIMDAVGE
jgi:hypothetical protein